MNEQLKFILEEIVKKTKISDVIWSKTSGAGFKINFSKAVIFISYIYDERNENYYHSVTVFNNKGESIFYYDTEELQKTSSEFTLLSEVYNVARNSYYNINETFECIVNELKTSKVIGKKDDDDDLPF
jgi:hypothetical protein